MGLYLAIAGVLWLVALLELGGGVSTRRLVLPALLFLSLFSGLRFETGYDWLVYERYCQAVPTLSRLLHNPGPGPDVPMEPLFYALNVVTRSLGGGLQALMLAAALFNGFVLYRYLMRYTDCPFTVLAAYFGWVFLSLQMAALRQSLALSMVILALMQLEPRRPWRYVLYLLIGSGIQYSIIIYLPLYGLLGKRIPKKVVYLLLAALSALYCLKISFLAAILNLIQLVSPGDLAAKLDFYRATLVPDRSLGAMAYVAVNVLVFGFGLTALRHRLPARREDHALYNLSLLFCVMHLLSPEVPVLWQRVQYLALPGQVVLAARVLRDSAPLARLAFWGGAAAATTGFLVFQLSSPWARPYKPYQNYAVHLATGTRGDGRSRTDAYYEGLGELFPEFGTQD